MKKVLVLLLALVMLVSVTACGAETVVVYVTADPNATEAPQESKGEGNNQDAANNKDNVAEGIEIVKQYTLFDKEDTERYVVVKNVTDKVIGIKSNTAAYDKDGNLVGADGDEIDVIAPGSIDLICEEFDDAEAESFVSNYTLVEVNPSKIPISGLKTETSVTQSKVIITATYEGEMSEFDVKYNILFFSGDKLVDTSWTYCDCTNGVPAVEEVHAWKQFDRVEVYPTGYVWDM